MANLLPSQLFSDPARVGFHTLEWGAHDEFLAGIEGSGVRLPPSLDRAVLKRRAEYAAGRLCAKQALKNLGGPHEVEIAIGEDRAPVWPAGWVGSITHSDGFAAAVVARTSGSLRAIGIDSESLMLPKTAQEVRGQVLSPWEIQHLPGDLETLTLVFSTKESLYKCLRPLVGRFFGFQAAEVRAIDLAQGQILLRLIESLGETFQVGFELSGRFVFEDSRVHTSVEL